MQQALEGKIEALDKVFDSKFEALDKKFDTKFEALNDTLLTLKGSIMSRAEVYAEDAKRVSLERFEGEFGGVRDRLARLEGGPQKILGWISLSVAAGFGCLSSILAAASVTVAIAAVLATVIIAIATH